MSGVAWSRLLLRLRSRRGGAANATADVDQLRESIRAAAAQPGALVPREEFVAGLHHRLRSDIEGETETYAAGKRSTGPPRRRVVQVAAGAVAAAAVGAAGERAVSRARSNPGGIGASLTPESSRWTPVAATAAASPGQPVAFSVANVAGVVVSDNRQLRALSAVCTHQGCLLRLDATRRQLDCPCHATAFSLTGSVLHHSLSQAPSPLPHLGVRERDGQIEVLLPRA